MNIKQLKLALSTVPSNITVMLSGEHGIGKSEIVNQVASEIWNQECVTFQATDIADPADIIGRQRINEETNHTEWVPPYWFSYDKPITLFLDEINRGTPIITAALMDLALNQKILNFKLPAGSHVICATNPASMGYDVEELDPAQMDRFVVFKLKPSTVEWLEWATENGVHDWVRKYIEGNPSDLDSDAGSKSDRDGIAPSRRSWKRLGDTLTQGEKNGMNWKDDEVFLTELVAGFVGIGTATKFVTFVRTIQTGLSPDKILLSVDFENEILPELKHYNASNVAEVVSMGTAVNIWMKENFEKDQNKMEFVANNYAAFLKGVKPEARQQIFISVNGQADHKRWIQIASMKCEELKTIARRILRAASNI